MFPQLPLGFLNALGGSPLEMAVVLVAVLVLFGAKSLPGTLRTLGRWSEQLRQISKEIQREITDAAEPARREWDEASKTLRVEQSSSRFAARPDPEAEAADKSEPGNEEPTPRAD